MRLRDRYSNRLFIPLLALAATGLLVAVLGASRATAGPVGFGQATTGGCSSPRCICHVREAVQAALLDCLSRPGSGTIVFDTASPIMIDSPAGGARATVKIPSNKTLAGPATLVSNGTTLEIDGQQNVVIRDIAFRSTLSDHPSCRNIQAPRDASRCGIAIYVLGGSRNIWIDHNDFARCGEKCIEIWAFPPRGEIAAGPVPAPDLITISNNRFADSYFGVSVGVAASIAPTQLPTHERVTMYNNLFDHIVRRSPRAASGAWIHAFNNYIRGWGGGQSCAGGQAGFGPSSVGGAQLVLENNIVEADPKAASCKRAVDIEAYAPRGGGEYRGAGLVRATNNKAVNGAILSQSNPSAVFDPRAYYRYTLLPPAAVASIVNAAGVRRPR